MSNLHLLLKQAGQGFFYSGSEGNIETAVVFHTSCCCLNIKIHLKVQFHNVLKYNYCEILYFCWFYCSDSIFSSLHIPWPVNSKGDGPIAMWDSSSSVSLRFSTKLFGWDHCTSAPSALSALVWFPITGFDLFILYFILNTEQNSIDKSFSVCADLNITGWYWIETLFGRAKRKMSFMLKGML